MNKKTRFILCLLAVLCFTLPTTTAEIILSNTSAVLSGSTTVRLVIPGGYTVEIPAALPLAYGQESTAMTIGVSDVKLGATQAVEVRVDSAQGTLAQTGGKGSIPYTLMQGDAAFSRLTFTQDGSAQVHLAIDKADWFEAPAGDYTGTVTFQVSIIQQEATQ